MLIAESVSNINKDTSRTYPELHGENILLALVFFYLFFLKGANVLDNHIALLYFLKLLCFISEQ